MYFHRVDTVVRMKLLGDRPFQVLHGVSLAQRVSPQVAGNITTPSIISLNCEI